MKTRLLTDRSAEILARAKVASEKTYILGELLTDEFMQKETGFESLHALLVAAGLEIGAIKGWEDLDTEVLNAFVRNHTRFQGFLEIRNAAMLERFGLQKVS